MSSVFALPDNYFFDLQQKWKPLDGICFGEGIQMHTFRKSRHHWENEGIARHGPAGPRSPAGWCCCRRRGCRRADFVTPPSSSGERRGGSQSALECLRGGPPPSPALRGWCLPGHGPKNFLEWVFSGSLRCRCALAECPGTGGSDLGALEGRPSKLAGLPKPSNVGYRRSPSLCTPNRAVYIGHCGMQHTV